VPLLWHRAPGERSVLSWLWLAGGCGRYACEYKQVTVLFADVVHSMSIASVVGAERLREIMAELVNRASVIVQRYGANVDQFTGDGIMAVFGAPVALEDHAFRACLAALEIQKEVQGLAADIDRRDGVELRLRIGLNSGQVRGRRCKAKAREALLNRPLPAALASTITPDSNMPGSRRTPASCALIYHDGGDRQRGFKVLAELRDMCAKQRYALNAVP
jgi:hypothetical protein